MTTAVHDELEALVCQQAAVNLALDLGERASVDEIIAARWRVADTALRQLPGDRIGSPEIEQAAVLIKRATDGLSVSGRRLFAGHTELPWPDEPHLRLWLGTSLLREYRGDGHLAALTGAEPSGIEAHITFVATGRSFSPARGKARRAGPASSARLHAAPHPAGPGRPGSLTAKPPRCQRLAR